MLVSCKKESNPAPADASPLKIVKKVAASTGDYVQYEYNAKGHVSRYISQWKDAEGNLFRQNNDFEYNSDDQLLKWSNNAGYVFYTHQNDRLSHSEHFAANGKKISTLSYTFDASDRLVTIVEEIANPLADGPEQTRVSYQYYSNGNLSRMDFAYRNKSADSFTMQFSKKLVQYDTKKNPEPDGILGAFLPGVILLLNNPVRIENILPDGTVEGYSRYEYTYNAHELPIQRKHYTAIGNVETPPVVFTYEY